MLDLSKLSSPFCAAGRAMRRREELLRRQSAAALRGDDQALRDTASALAVAEALLARHAKIKVAGGPVSTKIRPGGRVVTSPSISLEIQEVARPTGPERPLLTTFLLDLLALFRAAARPGQVSITDRLLFVESLHGGRTIPSLCLTPRLLAQRPQSARACAG